MANLPLGSANSLKTNCGCYFCFDNRNCEVQEVKQKKFVTRKNPNGKDIRDWLTTSLKLPMKMKQGNPFVLISLQAAIRRDAEGYRSLNGLLEPKS